MNKNILIFLITSDEKKEKWKAKKNSFILWNMIDDRVVFIITFQDRFKNDWKNS